MSSQMTPAKVKKTKRKRGYVVTFKRIEERTRCEEEAIIVTETTDSRGRCKGARSSSDFVENVLCGSQNDLTANLLNRNIPR